MGTGCSSASGHIRTGQSMLFRQGKVPRWWLAREGPFLAERSTATLRSVGAGCAFRVSDYASPTGEFGIPLDHPRFLEWIGVPESASLLDMSPGRWMNALSWDKAMATAVRLQRDEFGHSGSICTLVAEHCVEDDRTEPWSQ